MAPQSQLRIAMWSGPRNISTAMMRSFSNRPDTRVCDEPLYAYYLKATGRIHPGREATLANHETDWRRVVDWLTGPAAGNEPIYYQKQMAHHLLPEIDRGWLSEVTNCFLIRDPSEMLVSLVKHVPDALLEDTGLPQQVEIFRRVLNQQGGTPPVLDANEVLQYPRAMLTRLCDALGIEFTSRMLSWPPGRRETDGAWAADWYREVESSTSFRPYRPKPTALPAELVDLANECRPFYEELYEHRLRP